MPDGNPDGALMAVSIALRAAVGERAVVASKPVDQGAIGVVAGTVAE
jgi:hypothetical protein